MLAQSVSVLEAGGSRAAKQWQSCDSTRSQASSARLAQRGATSLRPMRQLLPSLPPRVPLPCPARATALLCPAVRPSFSRMTTQQALLIPTAPLTVSGTVRSAAPAAPPAQQLFSPPTPLLVCPSVGVAAMSPPVVFGLLRRAVEATARGV